MYFPVLNVAEEGQFVHYQYVEPLQINAQSLAVSELPGYLTKGNMRAAELHITAEFL